MVDELNLNEQDYKDVCAIIDHLIETGRTPVIETVGSTVVIQTEEPPTRVQAEIITVDFKNKRRT